MKTNLPANNVFAVVLRTNKNYDDIQKIKFSDGITREWPHDVVDLYDAVFKNVD